MHFNSGLDVNASDGFGMNIVNTLLKQLAASSAVIPRQNATGLSSPPRILRRIVIATDTARAFVILPYKHAIITPKHDPQQTHAGAYVMAFPQEADSH